MQRKNNYTGVGIKKCSRSIALILLTFILSAICLSGCSGGKQYQRFTIYSDSMAPEFYHDDVIAVDTSVTPDQLEVNDIITFSCMINGTESQLTHRIIDITEVDSKRYFQTKGDSNDIPDADLVPQDKVIGRFHHVISRASK